jgi:glyoxylase-like metal-dependent hydrolase (beta-lactamase superfamily II)
MNLRIASLLLLGACTGDTGPAGPPGPPGGFDPDAPALDKAYVGVGGKDALTALEHFTITADGERLMALEGFQPDDEPVTVSTFTTTTAADLTGDQLRIDYDRSIPVFGQTKTYSVIIHGDVGVLDGVESVFGAPGGNLGSDRWAAEVRQLRLLDPQLILRDIALGKAQATDAGLAVVDGEIQQRIDIADPVHALSLFVDPRTGELTKAATLENDHVEGDVAVEAFYVGWRNYDGDVRFPSDVAITLGGKLVHSEHRTAASTTAAIDPARFAFPAGSAPAHVAEDALRGERNHQFLASFSALGVPLEGLQRTIDAQEIAPGVFHLRGGSHHSLVVEQQSGIVLVEAPLYEARAQAILDWIKTKFPGKPVTHVIATHHHRDHTGSLRTLVAHDARVIVGDAARPFFAQTFRAARTIEPDELAAAPRTAAIDGVAPLGTKLIADAQRPVQAFAITSTHAADMLVIYLPQQKVLFVSDLFSPGFPPNPPAAREVLDAISARGVAVTTIAGGHGIATATFAELQAAAGQ